MILVDFPSGACVDYVVNNQTNQLFWNILWIAQECVELSEVNTYVCYKPQFETWTQPIWKTWWKTKTSKAVFSKFRQLLHLDVFCK